MCACHTEIVKRSFVCICQKLIRAVLHVRGGCEPCMCTRPQTNLRKWGPQFSFNATSAKFKCNTQTFVERCINTNTHTHVYIHIYIYIYIHVSFQISPIEHNTKTSKAEDQRRTIAGQTQDTRETNKRQTAGKRKTNTRTQNTMVSGGSLAPQPPNKPKTSSSQSRSMASRE